MIEHRTRFLNGLQLKQLAGGVFGFTVLFTLLHACFNEPRSTSESAYLNHHDTVRYVGMSTCAACHQDKAATFIHTGMGSSFSKAEPNKSTADFTRNHVVFDTANQLYYAPFWSNGRLFVREYRLDGRDTVHQRVEQIDYIIGSGQHTHSHLMNRNGFVYQVPLTWYAQEKHWGLPPGFEGGKNSRFSRIINDECMSCHNAMPVMKNGSEFLFDRIGNGIDCERCHGPGSLHVQTRSASRPILDKNGTDRTIVNPRKLSWERQVDVCQRCHLQGNAVLGKGKKFTDFRPGMKLSDYFEVYMPEYEQKDAGMIMASHAQRLQLSKCFTGSGRQNQGGKLTCISCHNPHVSVKVTGSAQYNGTCVGCHAGPDDCGEKKAKRDAEQKGCVGCHMKSSGTSDIPHVTVHDHYIRKPANNPVKKNGRIKGLYCVNNDNPTEESRIRAYLSYYEKFEPDPLFLLKADQLLRNHNYPELQLYYHYLKGESKKVIDYAASAEDGSNDAWLHYRIGQSFLNLKQYEQAEQYLREACRLLPYQFEFVFKRSIACHALGKQLEEETLLQEVLRLNPNHLEALNNLGYLYFRTGQAAKAFSFYRKAMKVNPDYLPLQKNLFDYYIHADNRIMARKTALAILRKEPGNKVLKDFINSHP